MTVSTDDYEKSVLIDINTQSASAIGLNEDNVTNNNTQQSQQGTLMRYSIPKEIADVLSRAIEVSRITGGSFDPTIEPVVNLWGFNSEEKKIPNNEHINVALSRVNWQALAVEHNTDTNEYELEMEAGQGVDVGAIAKGYAADSTRDFLKNAGVESAILDFGGNIVLLGKKKNGEAWNIGIQKPFYSGEVALVLQSTEAAVVTSGVYERYFTENGKQYFHIIDPRTGYPAENELLSATVVSQESTLADALSTAVFVMGAEKGMQLVERLQGTEVIFLTRDNEIIPSSGIREAIIEINSDYKMPTE
ncbi:FAD:protein FMN transferase-like [Ylistrum balloti]|uniref:FAD:protein FMN transferase-like n=1 Tax=Ylistrum balloti TaxID=509963 RepID=UPI002905E808|nr:FAD:protein FMN transferase-like [Ylistrum balloti]